MPILTPQQQISNVAAVQGIHGQNLATLADNIIYLLEQNDTADATNLLSEFRTSGDSNILTDTPITALRPGT